MKSMYVKYSTLLLLGLLFNTSVLFAQEVQMTPKEFIFSWQKANGDQYEIPVTNNMKIAMAQQRVNRALMQILLKSVLKRPYLSYTLLLTKKLG